MKNLRFMKAIFYLLICLISSTLFVKAQDNCTCELAPKLIPNIIRNFNGGNLDSAKHYIEQFGKSKTEACQANFFDGLAQIAISKKQYIIARDYLKREELIVKNLSCDNKPIIRFYNTISKYYSEINALDSTIIVALKIIELAENTKDKYGLARALINAGAIFSQLKNYSKANEYFHKANLIAKQQKDTTMLCASLVRLSGNYANLYRTIKKPTFADSLFVYATAVIQLARNPQDLIESMDAYSNLSMYYSIKKNYKKALLYADTILYKCPRAVHDFDRFLLNAFERKSEAYFELRNTVKSLEMADSAYYYANLFNKQLSIVPLELVYKNAKILNKHSKALWAFEQLTAVKDSMFSIEKNKIINELEKKYNQAKNEKTIIELSQQRKIYWLFMLVAVAIIVIIGFYLRQQKLHHKQQIMETEQRLNRARMNPHFFFNTLASLQSFALTETDNINLAANISKFSHIMRETLESTYKDYVTIEQEIDFLNEYLELQSIRFPQRFSYSINADKSLAIDELQIPAMIIQPFIENAIEHGLKGIDYRGEITIYFKQMNEELTIEIKDNGRGLSTVTKDNGEHISRASQIIKDRIYLLNIKLKTKAGFSLDNNKNGNGVLVKIHLPLLYK